MSEAHEKTRIRQLEDAAAHWEHKYANARQYNRNLEERNQRLEEALRRIMRGVDCSEQSYQYAEEALGTSVPDGNYTDSIDVPPPCDTVETPDQMHARIVTETADRIAKERGLTVETPVKPVCLRDTEAHGKGICEICEDGPCADEPTNNGIYAETWDERMGRKP